MMPNKEESKPCTFCDTKIDKRDWICCICIDNTEGRNQHFWQIKYEE